METGNENARNADDIDALEKQVKDIENLMDGFQ